MNQEEQLKKFSQIIARCWADDAYKQRLLTDTAAALAEEGVELPAGLEVKVVEDTAEVFHLVIPAKSDELSEEELDQVSGGIGSVMDSCNSCGGLTASTSSGGCRGIILPGKITSLKTL